jgi:hypothetical protein
MVISLNNISGRYEIDSRSHILKEILIKKEYEPNIVNRIMSYKVPFAVGAFMLTRRNRFEEFGGFAEKYGTSEDFFLSKKYDVKKFKLVKHYFGQDSRRFQIMGYFGMVWYLIKNFWNRNNESYWDKIDYSKYW